MSELEARFDALVAGVVVPALKPLGYRKRKLSWSRETPEAVHGITLQRSQGNAPDHLRFYVEVSAYVPDSRGPWAPPSRIGWRRRRRSTADASNP